MNPHDNDDSRSIALYWGFENLHAGLLEAKYGEGDYAKQHNRFKPQEPLIDVQACSNSEPPLGRLPSTAPTATGNSSAATVTLCCKARSN